jgi:hypothetical protein
MNRLKQLGLGLSWIFAVSPAFGGPFQDADEAIPASAPATPAIDAQPIERVAVGALRAMN